VKIKIQNKMKNILIIFVMLFSIVSIKAQANVKLGSYSGKIEISGTLRDAFVNLEIKDNQVKGTYSYGNFSGNFVNGKIEKHILVCDWVESENSKGSFKAIFNDDYSSFIGVWSYSNGKNGGSWIGKRQ
jgi:hypothetical protein